MTPQATQANRPTARSADPPKCSPRSRLGRPRVVAKGLLMIPAGRQRSFWSNDGALGNRPVPPPVLPISPDIASRQKRPGLWFTKGAMSLTIPTEHVDAMGAVVDAKKNSPLCRERHRRYVLHPPQEFSNHQFWKQMVGRLCSSVANHLNLTKNAGSTRRSEKGGQPSASAGRWQTRCFITGPTKPSSLPARSKPPATRPITPFNTCSICSPPEILRDEFSDWLC